MLLFSSPGGASRECHQEIQWQGRPVVDARNVASDAGRHEATFPFDSRVDQERRFTSHQQPASERWVDQLSVVFDLACALQGGKGTNVIN